MANFRYRDWLSDRRHLVPFLACFGLSSGLNAHNIGAQEPTQALSASWTDGQVNLSDLSNHEEPLARIAFQDARPLEGIQRSGPTDRQDRLPPNDASSDSSKGSQNSEAKGNPNDPVMEALLGGVHRVDELDASRRARAMSPASDAVLGSDARSRETSDTGNLLGKSLSVRGVSSQQRTPIVTDTRIRGERVGQVLASGSFWAPARMDLDTMMSKIDSRLIESLIVIKGPYSPRYGPGFSFVDIDLLATPRYENGFEAHGATSVDYQTNGEQWYGRQTVFGGSSDWGFRLSYGHRTGNDYETGAGFLIPSSYQSGDFNLALGKNITPDDRFEFNYLKLDQSDLEFPGLVYDLDYLGTDGYELKYFGTNPGMADQLFSEIWYNRTRFHGNTFAPGKQAQIPQLQTLLFSPSGFDGRAITNGFGSSFGYRHEITFGNLGLDHWALGTDLILLKEELNDIEVLAPPDDNNYPIPNSKSTDFGFYVERVLMPVDWFTVNAGARADVINTTAVDMVPGVQDPISVAKDANLDQSFGLWSSYVTSQIALTDHWKSNAGLGFGQRPPTLTELYAENAFMGSLQRGLTFLEGDPELAPEEIKQIDLGIQANYDRFRGGVHAYHAWINDYITYDLKSEPSGPDDGLGTGAVFVNTDLAILRGIEAYSRYQWLSSIAFFGTLSYTEGEDRSREKPARQWPFPRSGVAGVEREPLPGIAPLDSRAGVLWHDPSPLPRWGVEFSSRMVARQERIAASLAEIETPGFATFDIRSYRRLGSRNILTAGVENLTDKFYREHLDYRSGLGVFRPGINFYTGLEINY